jgi:hypothetical protein
MRGNFLAALVGGIVILGSAGAQAGMDYRCLAACQQAGYKHPYCTARCEAQAPKQSANPVPPAKHGTDYRCVDNCTGTGRPRPYCLKNCSY